MVTQNAGEAGAGAYLALGLVVVAAGVPRVVAAARPEHLQDLLCKRPTTGHRQMRKLVAGVEVQLLVAAVVGGGKASSWNQLLLIELR